MNDLKDLNTDALLASELNQLSLKEREQVYFDVHGVSDSVNEEPGFVDRCLDSLEAYTDGFSGAYAFALSQNEDYVKNREFRLMFLRAENFDVHRAADRLKMFFEEKLKLFGPEKLAKDITVDDLDEDDLVCLNSGQLQVLPLRDRAGRAVISWMSMLKKNDIRHRVSVPCTTCNPATPCPCALTIRAPVVSIF